MLETQRHYYAGKTEIIAEAACNHCGNINTAFQLVRSARESGADTIKFQSYKTDLLVNPGPIADFCRKCELSYEDHCAIIEECERENINPLFSAFDNMSLEMLSLIGMDAVKIPSGQVFNIELVKLVAQLGMKCYLSTGMCSMRDVRRAFFALIDNGLPHEDIVIMQCTTCYPAPFEDVNLRVIERYREEFGTSVGYSDHTKGWSVPIGAVAIGANVIEKHFMLANTQENPDTCVSLNPVEFRMMTMNIREIEMAVGTHVKRPRKCEHKMFHRKDYGGKK